MYQVHSEIWTKKGHKEIDARQDKRKRKGLADLIARFCYGQLVHRFLVSSFSCASLASALAAMDYPTDQYRPMDKWTMDERTDQWMNGSTNGRTDQPMGERTDQWTDVPINGHPDRPIADDGPFSFAPQTAAAAACRPLSNGVVDFLPQSPAEGRRSRIKG